MIMKTFTRDSKTKEVITKEIEVSKCFKDSKDILEDIIKRFDNELRTKVSGNYVLSLQSSYLTADTAYYTITIKDDNSELEIKNIIERDELSFIK